MLLHFLSLYLLGLKKETSNHSTAYCKTSLALTDNKKEWMVWSLKNKAQSLQQLLCLIDTLQLYPANAISGTKPVTDQTESIKKLWLTCP